MHQRFFQHLRDQISLVGVVKRRDTELEFVGNLRSVSADPAVNISIPLLTRTRSSRSTVVSQMNQCHWIMFVGKCLTSLVTMIRNLIERQKAFNNL